MSVAGSYSSTESVLLAPTILLWGTGAQKERFLRPTADGRIRWTQGYSEPEAGSDLFNVRTRAALEGDEWVVNGQKIWTSGALHANWIFAVVRTGTSAERAKGLSFLLIPLDQPGVEVRGIRSMAGDTELAEVYFTDILWPDFRKPEFIEALKDFARRERRFGDIAPKR